MILDRNTLEIQLAMARTEPETLLEWERTGVGIKDDSWMEAIATNPDVYRKIPARLKFFELCKAAMRADPLMFKYTPDRFQSEDDDARFKQAKRAAEAAEAAEAAAVAAAAPVAPAASVAPAAPAAPTALLDVFPPPKWEEGESFEAYIARLKQGLEQAKAHLAAVEQEAAEQAGERAAVADGRRGSEPKDASEEEASSDEESSEEESSEEEDSSDNDYASSGDRRRSPAKAVAVVTTGPAFGKRAYTKKKGKKAPRRPLHYSAELGTRTTKELNGGKAPAVEESGSIDLALLEKLVGPARRFAKLYSMAMNEGATPTERAHAQAKMDQMVAQGSDDVLRAFTELRESNRKCNSERVAHCRTNIYYGDVCNGVRAQKRPAWMQKLAHGVGEQFMVSVSVSPKPLMFGFYGDEMGAAAAAEMFKSLIGDVCLLATCESWAEGFACGYKDMQMQIKKASQKVTSESTALVVSEKKDLVAKAKDVFLRKAGKRPSLKCKKRNLHAFSEGKAAGSEQAVSKTTKRA